MEILSLATEMGIRAKHFILEIPNTPRRSGMFRAQDAHLTSDATFQVRNSLFQGAIKYSEKLHEVMDANISSQSETGR